MLHEQGPIYREKSSPMPELQMNESPDMDLNAELARNAEPEGRYSRVNNENPRYAESPRALCILV